MKTNWKFYLRTGICVFVWVYTFLSVLSGLVPYGWLIPVAVLNMVSWTTLAYTFLSWWTGTKLILMTVPLDYKIKKRK